MTDERTTKFATSCEKCVFAQWKDGVQLDTCDLGRIEKYIEQKKTESHPNGYHIVNTVCNTCRGTVWANQHLGENLVAVVEEEIKLRVDIILMSIDDNPNTIVKQLPELVKKCSNQKQIKPQQILVVLRNNNLQSQDVYDILREECNNIPYKLIRIIDFSANKYECLDMAVKKCYSQYYAVFDLHNNIPINFIQTLNNIINNELKYISMVEPVHQFSGMVVQTYLHNLFCGNKEYTIREKIKQAAKIQQREDYIYTWEQLWNSQK